MNFAEKMDELEKILVALVRECRAYLEDAQKKITMLSQEYAAPQTGAEEA